MRLVLLARSATDTNRWILAAAWRLGIEAELVSPTSAVSAVRSDDVVLNRLDVCGTLDGVEEGLDAVHELAARGIQVLNPPEALATMHDKLLTAIRLRRAGIPHPATAWVDETMNVESLEPPFVVKPRFGSWGRDVMRCGSRQELARLFEQLADRRWFRAQGALVQELVPAQGRDLRLVVAGGAIIGAITRVAAPGEWRTNVALGASSHSVDPPDDACATALEATEAVGADLAGVDLLPDGDGGYVVVELNGAVDFKPHYALNGADVFERAVSACLGLEQPALAAVTA
jgi:[lysine-biosynthesis-protein LysW]--L-2-aminoadipate ligase